MEGFKANPKMKSDIACFKEGGSVYKSRTHKEDPAEVAEDKAMVKKGIRQHEASKHKGEEKTEIKLKAGRRVAKTGGVVNKFKSGGGVSNPMKSGGGVNASEKGKPSGDKDKTKKVTAKPKKASAPSAAAAKKAESPATGNRPAAKTMSSSSVGELPPPAMAPSAAMSMPEEQPIEMMADGGQAAPYMMSPMGLGQAAVRGPLGTAAPLGAMQQTNDVMRGLQAIGQYCSGGKAY